MLKNNWYNSSMKQRVRYRILKVILIERSHNLVSMSTMSPAAELLDTAELVEQQVDLVRISFYITINSLDRRLLERRQRSNERSCLESQKSCESRHQRN
jgi:hypothetical protein